MQKVILVISFLSLSIQPFQTSKHSKIEIEDALKEYLKVNELNIRKEKIDVFRIIKGMTFLKTGNLDCLTYQNGFKVVPIELNVNIDEKRPLDIDHNDSDDSWSEVFQRELNEPSHLDTNMSDVYLIEEGKFLVGFSNKYRVWAQLFYRGKDGQIDNCIVREIIE